MLGPPSHQRFSDGLEHVHILEHIDQLPLTHKLRRCRDRYAELVPWSRHESVTLFVLTHYQVCPRSATLEHPSPRLLSLPSTPTSVQQHIFQQASPPVSTQFTAAEATPRQASSSSPSAARRLLSSRARPAALAVPAQLVVLAAAQAHLAAAVTALLRLEVLVRRSLPLRPMLLRSRPVQFSAWVPPLLLSCRFEHWR